MDSKERRERPKRGLWQERHHASDALKTPDLSEGRETMEVSTVDPNSPQPPPGLISFNFPPDPIHQRHPNLALTPKNRPEPWQESAPETMPCGHDDPLEVGEVGAPDEVLLHDASAELEGRGGMVI